MICKYHLCKLGTVRVQLRFVNGLDVSPPTFTICGLFCNSEKDLVLPLEFQIYLVNGVDPNLLEEFADTFGDIGCLSCEYKIKVDSCRSSH